MGFGEGIEETVGGAVVDLADGAQDGDGRGAEEEEVERLVAQHCRQGQGASDLGLQDSLGHLSLLELHQAAARYAGGMDHAVKLTEAFANLGQGGAHLCLLTDVGGEHQHLRPERLERLDLADAQARAVVLVVALEPGFALVLGR